MQGGDFVGKEQSYPGRAGGKIDVIGVVVHLQHVCRESCAIIIDKNIDVAFDIRPEGEVIVIGDQVGGY